MVSFYTCVLCIKLVHLFLLHVCTLSSGGCGGFFFAFPTAVLAKGAKAQVWVPAGLHGACSGRPTIARDMAVLRRDFVTAPPSQAGTSKPPRCRFLLLCVFSLSNFHTSPQRLYDLRQVQQQPRFKCFLFVKNTSSASACVRVDMYACIIQVEQ